MSIRLSSNDVANTALLTLNATVAPTPLTPATPSAFATLSGVSGVNLRGSDILDSTTVAALISQQSATNTTLDAASRIVQGIVPGQVGATLAQISNPGSMLKPGLEDFVQSKLNMGLSFQQSVSNSLLTGNFGARTVDGIINNVNGQVAAVTSSITGSVNGLIGRGIISGTEPATQIAGVALGASTFGLNNVTGALSNVGSNLSGAVANIGTNITGAISNIGSNLSGAVANIGSTISGKLTGLSNMISSGNFASGVVDKLGGSIASSVSGALTGAIGGAVGTVLGKLFGGGKSSVTVDQLQQQLSSSARRAHIEAEAALVGTMKPNEANYLSDDIPRREISEAEQLALKIESTKLDLEFADSEAISARIAYNLNPSPENRAALTAAEAKLASAKQQVTTVASDILSPKPKKKGGLFGGLKNPLSAVTDKISSVTETIRSTVQQGVNMYNNVTKAATLISTAYATGGLSLLANSKLAGSISALTNPAKLAGDMVGKFNQSLAGLKDSAGQLSGVVTAGESKIKNLLGSLGGTKGVKTATYADNTDKNKAAIAGNTGQLLGSSLVPPPPTITGETVTDSTPNEYVRQQREAIEQLDKFTAERQLVEFKIEQLYAKLGNSSNSSILAQIQSERNKLTGIDAQLARAQQLYENTIRGA